ncbi:hypothetical protein IW140_004549 [Coemansia sp. RSA 1813]|nr:hypothetical protein LPJ74_005944 [Coemansia sp. RSA 1843]KAJ2212654.1 hypothetical protein EV179_004480 [Coemansia sp. RSA 487]KAJ2567336.1 hypothetical protein IW140_004549 [Coemansia sp. RSA 1813]
MHDYNITTFASPTYCEYCGGFLWGLTKQGVRCGKCKTTAHKKCALIAETQCTGDRGLATLVPASPLFSVSSPGSSSATISSPTDSTYISQLDSMFWQQLDEEVKLNDLVSAQAEQPLSLFQTLPSNFMQFTAKLAPLALVNRAAIAIVMWRRPKHSVAAMAVYTMYCLRPNLLLATPLMVLIAYIVFNYFNSEHWHGGSSLDGASSSARAESPSINALPADSADDHRRASSQTTASAVSSSMRGRSSTSSSIIRMRRRGSQPPASPYPQIKQSPTLSKPTNTKSPGSSSSPPEAAQNPADTHATMSANSSAKAAEETYDDVSVASPLSSPKGRMLVRARSSSANAADGRNAKVRQRTDLEAIFGVASFGSARHTENVHTTQIMTGTYVHIYDWIAAHNHMVDWSQPEVTWRILAACVCAQLGLLVVVYWVPWYMLFLVGGNSALLSMSPHMRAFAKVYGFECVLCIHEWMVLKWLRLRIDVLRMPVVRWVLRRRKQRSRAATKHRSTSFRSVGASVSQSGNTGYFGTYSSDSDSDSDNGYGLHSGYLTPPPLLSLASSTAASSTATLVRRPHMVSVFENQRWWLGFGWIPRLGTNERAKWSDETGKRKYASINDFMPVDGYEWADEGNGWEVDKYWALPVRTDEDGWVYTDNFWRHPSPASSMVSSYTRRRKWMRKVRPRGSRQETAHAAVSTTP